MLKRTAALAAAAGALALAGCGEDEARTKAAHKVAKDFAAADGPEACALMTENALEDVYGLDDSQNAYYNCVDRSDRFEGEEIEIDDTDVGDDDRITVKATSAEDERNFKVTLMETSRGWRVDRVIEE